MAQPQLLQVKLSRFDAQPWGFRLQGGTDFAQPLLVQKVNAGSLSEQAGLQPGDAVVKINDVDVFNLRHKDAQDIVVRSGNNFVITVQRGGSTWRPHVTPTGNVPQPNSPYLQTVTKTSLAHKQQDSQHIGCGYNNAARPFSNGGDGGVKSIVNKQYNTPVGIYSDESIAETLSAQAEVLAGGVLGVNFKKNEKEYQGDRSEVLKFLREEETGQSTPEPHSPANFYWTQSHAIGGNERRTPLHHQHQQLPLQQQQPDERIGVPLQSNTLAPEASHRPSLPVAQKDKEEQTRQDQEQADPRIIVMPICPTLQGPEYKAEMEAAAAALAIDQDGRPRPLAASGHPACQLCGVGIVGVFVRIKDKNLHVECFKCATCGTSLKNQGYYNFNNKLYCDIHAKQAAINNPPSGTEGYVPVPIKPNTKLSASTISSALNSHGYGGNSNGYSNGNSAPAPAPVNQGYARPFGAAAPKSPVSYPPQQQQQSPRPAPGGNNPYATLPRSNVGQQGRNVRYQQQQQQYNNQQQQKQQYRNSYPMGSNYSTPSQSPYITSNTTNYNNNNNNYSTYNNNNNNVYRDELVRPDQALTPTRPYTPSLTNKPAPIVPFYQTEEKLVFEECSATHARNYNELNASPFPDRTRSPAPGPPPNPLNAIRAPRMKEPEPKSTILSVSGAPRLQTGSITTGQSYQGQLLAHSEQSSQSASQSFTQQPQRITEQRVGNLNIQQREQSSQLQQQAQSQSQSQTRSQVGNTQIERRRKVTEEFERTQSAKTIEIRTGSQSITQSQGKSQSISQAQAQSQSQNQSDTERRSSYGKTGFVANQAKRLSCLEQEISSLTSQSQAISARASALGEGCFPNLRSPTFDSKFPLKPAPVESTVPGYGAVPAASNKLMAPPPGFLQQQQLQQQQKSAFSGYQATTSSVQQSSYASSSKATSSSLSSSSASASASASVARSSQSLTQASAITTTTNNQATTAYRSSNGSNIKPNLASRPSIASITGSANAPAPAPAPFAAPIKATAPFKTPIAPKSVIANAVNAAAPPAPAVFPPDLSDLNLNSNVPDSPGAGGKSAGAFGATSAPKRGRGILNKAAGPGVRIPLCNSCNVQIRGPFITALGRIWCPDHFICVNGNCRRPLQDIGFVEEKGDLYCEYCFEKYLAPTCSKCAGKIKGDCLNAIGKHFHPECFTCGQCGKIFGNRPFFLEDGNAYCEADWNELFTTKCFACGFPVEAGDRWVEALNHNYHSQCFNCTFCKQNLEGQSFYNKGGRPFCKNHAR
ncbi:PDZ and LIM domain protein Zasp isoform X14 [Drosophila eugracilis]|uniref:PDZ and LIM domain protein Zasp isoform X14 n=1 Tax=Drosophila eugracilis TaxID=29029 RepID=UPI0007E72186|nr:PDZ and LIM domain protein Zasp isoform X14 [Drosophila eugracilis]